MQSQHRHETTKQELCRHGGKGPPLDNGANVVDRAHVDIYIH